MMILMTLLAEKVNIMVRLKMTLLQSGDNVL